MANGAPNGTRVIELNGKTLGLITQTVTVEPNMPLTLSLYHKSTQAPNPGYGEKMIVEVYDSANNLITSVPSTAVFTGWTKVSTSFVAPTSKVTIKLKALTGSQASAAMPLGLQNLGNLIDNVTLGYAACVCPCIPGAPTIVTNSTAVTKCQTTTLSTTGCDGGTIKWSNGATGSTLTTNTPGTYTAQCIIPGTTCPSPASAPVTLTGSTTDIEVTCPTATFVSNGSYRIHFCIKNIGTTPVSGKDTIIVNGAKNFTGTYTDIAPGDSACVDYVKSLLPCSSTVNVQIAAVSDGETCLSDNSCSTTFQALCTPAAVGGMGPNGLPLDPNYKHVSPMRSLEGGIFPSDEWLTYTVHCQNDGLGICHNAIMVDTIDTSKLDISTLQILGSKDPVHFTSINANTVSFDFFNVNLASSFDNLPASQTEVIFKIKRQPNQPVGTEIYNRVGIYFDQNEVVNTEYAASKIIEPCAASETTPGKVISDLNVTAGTNVTHTFRVSEYDGVVGGWEVSTDPTFATNVQQIINRADTLAFNGVVNGTTYVRALVQTGACAMVPSKPAAIRTDCANLIQNGSFEDPAIANKSYAFKKMPGWTNLADNNTMELHHNLLTNATEGNQYIEMNSYNFGNIYQDFTVEPGKAIDWKMDHKARAYTNEKITVILSAPDGSNASQPITHTGSLSSWQSVLGSYQVAPTQTSVRIKIVSSGGAAAAGNLLDNVKVQYDYCETEAASKEAPTVNESTVVTGTASIAVHPNPTTAVANVNLTGFEEGTIALDVFNATGQTVKTMRVQYIRGIPIAVDLSGIKAGMFLIKATQGERTAHAKIVKN